MDDSERPGTAPEAQAQKDPPSIGDAIGQLRSAGRESLSAGTDTLRALRRLVVADLALARVALARALVCLTLGVAFGASAWMLLMAACIALLRYFGMSWLASTSLMAALSLLVAGIAGWRALRYFEMSRLEATRRQLARLGIGGDHDDDDDDDDAATGASAQDRMTAAPATERAG